MALKPTHLLFKSFLLAGLVVLASGPAYSGFTYEKEGCTPGYWKNHLAEWANCINPLTNAPFSPGDTIGDVFGLFAMTGISWPNEIYDLFQDDLITALKYHGGPGLGGAARIMLRQAVAGLLNSTHSGVFYWIYQYLISHVTSQLSTLDRGAILWGGQYLTYLNEMGCPLNGKKSNNWS